MKNKRILLAVLCASLSIASSTAQTPFSTSEKLDINYFNAAHMVHGDMWYDPSTGSPSCEYPKGTGKHASYMSSIWMSAKDNSGNLYVTAQRYQGTGLDYWPGPLDASGNLTLATSTDWARIWKVDASTINSFKSLYSTSGASAVIAAKYDVIKEWPAKGNIYAKGNAGASLPQLLSATHDYAPFVDVNGDGIYNWKDGDYPKIKGEQMLWWVFSDNGPTHNSSKGVPLKIEYHAMAYGYKRGTDVDRIMFYEFIMHNKSVERYNDFRFAFFSDADLGSPFDDYIAFDSAHRMGIEYNAKLPDGPGTNSYGNHPPFTGLSFIEMPGDVYPSAIQPAGSFNTFNNTATGLLRDPNVDTVYNHYINGRNADGGINPFGKYNFPISKGAIMCDSAFPNADRRYLIASNDYLFQPNTKTKIAMAFMATDTNGYACPITSFKPITDLADTAWKVYWNPLPPLSSKELIAQHNSFKLYPNPAQTILYVQSMAKAHKDETIRVIDALGKTIALPITHRGNQYEINISALSAGVYSVLYYDGESLTAQRFVKE